jgi:hypothetical protein
MQRLRLYSLSGQLAIWSERLTSYLENASLVPCGDMNPALEIIKDLAMGTYGHNLLFFMLVTPKCHT